MGFSKAKKLLYFLLALLLVRAASGNDHQKEETTPEEETTSAASGSSEPSYSPRQTKPNPTVSALDGTLHGKKTLSQVLSEINKPEGVGTGSGAGEEGKQQLANFLWSLDEVQLNILREDPEFSWLEDPSLRSLAQAIIEKKAEEDEKKAEEDEEKAEKDEKKAEEDEKKAEKDEKKAEHNPQRSPSGEQQVLNGNQAPPRSSTQSTGLSAGGEQAKQQARDLRTRVLSTEPPKSFDPKEEYTPGTDPLRDDLRKMADIYASFYSKSKDLPGRDSSLFPFLEETTRMIRDKTQVAHGNSALERIWEHELSEAMRRVTPAGVSTESVMNESLENSSQWARGNSMGKSLPNIAGAESVNPSYEFAKRAMETLGLLEAASYKIESGQSLSPDEKEKVKESLTDFLDYDFVKKRPNEASEPSLRQPNNQYMKWGKVFSLEVFRALQESPDAFNDVLPKSLQNNPEALKTLETAMRDSLFKNAQEGVGARSELGVGGSNNHTAMVGSMLAAGLSSDQLDELVPKFLGLLEKKGAKEGIYSYAPGRSVGSRDTYRDNAGRGISVTLSEYLQKPNEETMNKAVSALERLNLYSGSYLAHVNRSGVHSGADSLAPYYWSPALFSAGRLISEISKDLQENPNRYSEEVRERFHGELTKLEKSILASWQSDQKAFAHMGKETYQQLGPTAVTAPSLMALRHIAKAQTLLENQGGDPVEAPSPGPGLAGPTPQAGDDTPPAPDLDEPTPRPEPDARGESSRAIAALAEQVRGGLPPQREQLQKLQQDFLAILKQQNPRGSGEIKNLLSTLGVKPGDAAHDFLLSSAFASGNDSSLKAGASDLSRLMELQSSSEQGLVGSLIRTQAILAINNQKEILENKQGLDWFGVTQPLLSTDDEALLRLAQRREKWESGDKSDQEAVARELARELYSVSPADRKRLQDMASQIQSSGQSPDSMEAALKHLYGSGPLKNSELGGVLDREKASARQRAIDWNKKLLEGDPKWLQKQVELSGGADHFLKWAAQAGGENADQALRQLLSDGGKEVQAKNNAQTFEVGDTLELRTGDKDSPSGDLRKMLFHNREGAAGRLQIALGEKNLHEGRLARIDSEGKVAFVAKNGADGKSPVDPTDENVPPVPRDIGSLGPTGPAAGPGASSASGSAKGAAGSEAGGPIGYYENLKYGAGKARYRFTDPRFPEGLFNDVPEGGTGKMILAYFGNQNPALEERVAEHPLVEVRNYPLGSPEHQHAQTFNTQALLLDGLGRKVTRFQGSPNEALSSVLKSPELKHLENYLAAKKERDSIPHEDPAEREPAKQDPAEKSSFDSKGLGHFAQGNCKSCHETPFPDFTSNWQDWEKKLQSDDAEAKSWLERFNSKVVHGEMLRNAGLGKEEGEGAEFRKFISEQYQKFFTKAERPTSFGSPEAEFLIDPSKKAEYLEALKNANIQDPALLEALAGFDGMWDAKGNPHWSFAHHGGDSGRVGARPLSREPASPVKPHLFKKDREGNWAWVEPFDGGFSVDSKTQGINTFTLVKFPRDEKGDVVKGVQGTEKTVRSNSDLVEPRDLDRIWASFPDGTQFFEVQYNTKLGKPTIYTILSREKRVSPDGKDASFVPDVFKADSSPEQILSWVARKEKEAPQNPDWKKIRDAVENPVSDRIGSELGADRRGGTPFVVNGQRANQLPASKSILEGVSEDTLKQMYQELPLTSSAGAQGWQLEPQDLFSATHRGLAVTGQNCNNCHRFAGESFGGIFKDSGLDQSWGSVVAYGSAQGFDGVLSAPWASKEMLDRYETSARNPARNPYQPGSFIEKFFNPYDPKNQSDPRLYRRFKPMSGRTNGPLQPVRR